MNNLECEGKEVSIGFRNPHLVYLYSTDTRRAKVHRGVCVRERERERERATLLGNNVERRRRRWWF